MPSTVPGPVLSPCISVCRMNDITGLCEGCQRTIDEIAAWSRLDDDAKRAVWQAIGQRRIALRLPAQRQPGAST